MWPQFFISRLYCGLIIALLATAIAEGRLGALLGSMLVILGVWQKARTEERFLLTEFGPEIYGAYCRRVPMLIARPDQTTGSRQIPIRRWCPFSTTL
jgi:hypothetical protein